MDKIWKGKIDENLKSMLCRATTETILLCRSQRWALIASGMNVLNCTYRRMLRKVKNLSWKDKVDEKTNTETSGQSQKPSGSTA